MEIQNIIGASPLLPCRLQESTHCSEHQKDYILPGTTEDIARLLHYTLTLRQDSSAFIRQEAGTNASYQGEVLCSVLFLTEPGTVDSVSFSFPYSGSCRLPEAPEDAAGDLSVGIERAEVRLCNPRKIGVRVGLCAAAMAYGHRDLTPQVTWQKEEKDRDGVYGDGVPVQAVKRSKNRYGGIRLSHDIELEGTAPVIGRVVYETAEGVVTKAAAASDGYDIEGELRFTCLCEEEMPSQGPTDGAPFPDTGDPAADSPAPLPSLPPHGQALYALTRTLPFTEHIAFADYGQPAPQMLGSPRVLAWPEVESVQVNVAENHYGERKVLEVDVGLAMVIETAENVAVAIVADLFSTDWACEVSKKAVPVTALAGTVSDTVTAVSEESGDGALCIFARAGKPVLTADDGGAFAEIPVGLWYLRQEEDGITAVSSQVSARYPVKESDGPDAVSGTLNAAVREVKPGRSGGTEVELTVWGQLLTEKQCRTADRITLDGSTPAPKNDAKLIFFYPDETMTAYDIAKRYRVPPQTIKTDGDGPVMICR